MAKMDYACSVRVPTDLSGGCFDCTNCETKVHDLRDLSRTELQQRLNTPDGGLCGIVYDDQLLNSTQDQYRNIRLLKHFLIASVFVFGTALYTNAQEIKENVEQEYAVDNDHKRTVTLELVKAKNGKPYKISEPVEIMMRDTLNWDVIRRFSLEPIEKDGKVLVEMALSGLKPNELYVMQVRGKKFDGSDHIDYVHDISSGSKTILVEIGQPMRRKIRVGRIGNVQF